MVLGIKIKQLRTAKDLTLEQLAAEIGIKKQQIWNYENGKSNPPIEKVNLLASFFGIQPSELLNNNDESKLTSDAWAQKTVDQMQERINSLEADKKYLQDLVVQLAATGKGNFLKGNVSLFPLLKNGNITPQLAA